MRIGALVLKRKSWEPSAFASPSLVLIALVIVFPLAYSFWLSFQNFDLSVGPDSEFVGGAELRRGALQTTPASSAPSGTPRSSSGRRSCVELLLGLGLALLLSRVGPRARRSSPRSSPSPPWCRR